MKGLCMRTSVIWRRPDLQFPPCFDTIFFDIDGVLIKTTASFRAADIAVAEYVAGTIHGLDWGQQEGEQQNFRNASAIRRATFPMPPALSIARKCSSHPICQTACAPLVYATWA